MNELDLRGEVSTSIRVKATFVAASLGVAAFGAAPSFAQSAGGGSDMYASFALGVIAPTDTSVVFPEVPGSNRFDFDDMQASLAIRAAVGRIFSESLRAEIELSHQSRDVGQSALFGGGTIDVDGRISMTSLMVNGFYTAPLGSSGYGFYAGGGLGYARLETDVTRGPSNPAFVLTDSSSGQAAAQVRLGVEREMSGGTVLFADYTAFGLLTNDFDGMKSSGVTPFAQKYVGVSHIMSVGVRFSF